MTKKIKIAFQIDNPSILNLKSDSSYLFMKELLILGYEIYYYEPQNLIYKNNEVLAKCKKFGENINLKYINDFNAQDIIDDILHFNLSQTPQIQNLEEFYSIFIRQNPPFNMSYITTTYILDILKSKGVRILNDSTSLRNCSEKTFALEFSQFMPQTLITSDFDEAKAFYKSLGSEIILKPLYGYGGDAVFYISKKDKNLFSAFTLLKERFENLPVICQEYIPQVVTIGDKRIFLINGDVVFLFARTQAEDMSVSSSRLGGGYVPCDLTSKEEEIIKTLKPRLNELKLDIVGLDIIGGGYLTEINVTSPTGIGYAHKIYKQNYSKQIIKKLNF